MTASKSILLRVTPQEHAEIASRAQTSGQSLSRFLVSRALGDAPATWATAPRGELARAREALQAALRALEEVRDHQPCEVASVAPQEATIVHAIEVDHVGQEAAIVPAIEAAPVVQEPSLPEPEIVFVSAPHPSKLEGRLIRWVKAVGSVDMYGENGHAIHAPKGSPPFLKDDAEARLLPGTLIVAQAQTKSGRLPILVYGWTVAGKERVEWALGDLLDWSSSKLSSLQDLRRILRRGPPGSPAPAPEPVATVEVRPLTPAEQEVAAELDEALATTTTNPFDNA